MTDLNVNGDLTYRENLLFQFIRTYTETHDRGPSIREMATGAHLASTSSVAYVLKRLEAKGYITRLGGRQAVSVVPGHAGKVVVSREDLAQLLMSPCLSHNTLAGDSDAVTAFHRLLEQAGLW